MKKVMIVGAGGNVGGSLAQWLMGRVTCELVLVDLQVERAQARCEDFLQSQVGELGFPSVEFFDQVEKAPQVDVAVITAGVPRKPGQTREELVQINQDILSGLVKDLARTSPHAILLVVSNPLDAMTEVAFRASGFEPERIIGSAGCLDSSRFAYQIAKHLKVSLKGVEGVVLGAHTDADMVPVLSQARVNGLPLSQLCEESTQQSILEATKQGGASLTKGLGTSAWLAPAASTGLMVECLVKNDTRWLPCSVQSQGVYGLRSDLFIGLMTKLTGEGVQGVQELPLNSKEEADLKKAADSIENLLKSL